MVPETVEGLGGVGIDVQRYELEMQIRALPEDPGTQEDPGAAKIACPNSAFNRNQCCSIPTRTSDPSLRASDIRQVRPALEMNTGIQSGRRCATINPGSIKCVLVEL
jgi:hypothetical protein